MRITGTELPASRNHPASKIGLGLILIQKRNTVKMFCPLSCVVSIKPFLSYFLRANSYIAALLCLSSSFCRFFFGLRSRFGGPVGHARGFRMPNPSRGFRVDCGEWINLHGDANGDGQELGTKLGVTQHVFSLNREPAAWMRQPQTSTAEASWATFAGASDVTALIGPGSGMVHRRKRAGTL